MRAANEFGPAGLLLASVASRLHFVQRIMILQGLAPHAPDMQAILMRYEIRGAYVAPTRRRQVGMAMPMTLLLTNARSG